MPDNALLYTMTTVAESLGSAMALLAAFALYRLQSLSSQMQADADRLKDAIGGFSSQADKERLILLASAQDWNQYMPHMEQIAGMRSDPGVDARAAVQRMRSNYGRRRAVFAALWAALVLTAFVMTGALAALAASDHLRPCRLSPWAAVGGFVVCLVSYLVLIWLALSNRRARP